MDICSIFNTTHQDFQWCVYWRENWKKWDVSLMKTQKNNLFFSLLISIYGMVKSLNCTFSHPLTNFMNSKSTHPISNNNRLYVKNTSTYPITYLTRHSYLLLLMVLYLLEEFSKQKILNLPLTRQFISSIHRN